MDIRKQWARLIEIASRMLGYELTGKKADFFNFRHTGASHIAAKSRDGKHLMGVVRMMGDTSLATVNKHYFNLDDETLQAVVEGWGGAGRGPLRDARVAVVALGACAAKERSGIVHHDKSGFVLIRLSESIPSFVGNGPDTERRYIELSDRRTSLRAGDLAWLWRDHRGTWFDGVAGFEPGEPRADGTILVPIRSAQEQAGCACVDRNLNVIALHYGRDRRNRNASLIMPLATIISSLLRTEFRSLLYEDYAI
ncbi:MAG TPA: hypothetical protein VJ276_25745 [Thermoanaerobaculia bacterium]|nr:hypothetical protein [Thermoanaerobaculia bacterium]